MPNANLNRLNRFNSIKTEYLKKPKANLNELNRFNSNKTEYPKWHNAY